MRSEKVYFLDDEPKKDLQKDDAFGHVYYARTLYEILEKTETNKPYSIGLFGKWGVGKTSIINELDRLIIQGKSVARNNYKILKLDAWEYSEQNFRREFLLDLGGQFHCREEVRDRITTKRIIETKEAPKYDWKWFTQLLKQLGIFLCFWVVSYFVLKRVGVSISESKSVIYSMLFAGFAGAATIFRDNIKELFKFQTTIQETEPAVHPDQFKEIFKFIIDKKVGFLKEKDRLVIVLDNLDRVKEEIVIQILGAIKTFLMEEKCIYILPCDDKGLKQHIISMRSKMDLSDRLTESQANEYLRKFFQTTLAIRNLLTEDLESFTDEVLDKLIIFDLPVYNEKEKVGMDREVRRLNRDEVALILRVAIAKNPRRIIQLANKLSANYILAKERGKENSQLCMNILSKLGFLAKVTVIEEEWPDFYSFILEYPDTLRQLHNYFITEDEKHMPYLLQKKLQNNAQPGELSSTFEWSHGLSDFLKQTNTVYSDYVSDFLLFKQKPTIPLITNYYRFRDAALIRQADVVEDIAKNEATDIDAAFTELVKDLDKQSRIQNIPSSLSLMYCMVKIFHLIPDENTELQHKVANKISESLSNRVYAATILDVGLPELLMILHHSQRAKNTEKLISNIIDNIRYKEEPENAQFILDQLVEHHTLLTADNRKHFKEKLTEPSQDSGLLEDFRRFADKCRITEPRLAEDLISQEFYIQNINLLQSPGPAADDALKFLKDFFPFFEQSTKDQYIELILQHFEQAEDTLTPRKTLALNCIRAAPMDLVPESKRKHLAERLRFCCNHFPNLNHKNQVTEAFLHLIPVLKPDEQEPYHPCLVQTIDNSDPQFLSRFIKVTKDQRESLFDLDTILVRIQNRVKTHITNHDLRREFYDLADTTEKPNLIQELIVSVWGQPDHALPALDEAKRLFSPEEFRDLVVQLLEATGRLSADKLERALEALGSHRDRYSKQFLHTLTEELLNNWFQKPSVEPRRGAKKFWQGIRDKAKNERERFHRRVLEYCVQPINDNTIVQDPEKLYIQTLLEDYQYLSERCRKQLVELCLRMTEAARPQGVKNYGHELLRSLAKDRYAQKRVPEELLSDLEQKQHEQDMRDIFVTLQHYKEFLSKSMLSRLSSIFKTIDNAAIIQDFKEYFEK